MSKIQEGFEHVFVLDRGIDNLFCSVKEYSGMRELHGSMGQLKHLDAFLKEHQDKLDVGDLDTGFVNWIETTSSHTDDVLEYLYEYDMNWGNPQKWAKRRLLYEEAKTM